MKVVSVDRHNQGADNYRMTTDERRRVGLAIRALRVGKELDQTQVAAKVKLSVGTVQAIEGAWYEVKDSNIERVAKFFGTSVRKLLEPTDGVAPNDPILQRLRREDLTVANNFHDAATPVRLHVMNVLKEGELDERAVELATRVMRLRDDELDRAVELIASLEQTSVAQAGASTGVGKATTDRK